MAEYNFILTVSEKESDDVVLHIEALSLASLEEKLYKVNLAIDDYEAEKSRQKDDADELLQEE